MNVFMYVYCGKYYKTKQQATRKKLFTKECLECLYEHIFIEVCLSMSHDLSFSHVVYVAEQESLLAEFFCCTENYHMNNVECSQSTSIPLKFTTLYIQST